MIFPNCTKVAFMKDINFSGIFTPFPLSSAHSHGNMHKVEFCIKECDRVEYNKIITFKESLIKSEAWYEVKGKYASYHKSKGINEQSTNVVLKDFIMDKNNTFVDESLKMFWNSIVYDEPDKYVSRRFEMYKDLIIIHLRFMKPEFDLIDVKHTTLDKFANFGGNFGIFAEMTGVSFLGILNLFIVLLKTLYSSIKCK